MRRVARAVGALGLAAFALLAFTPLAAVLHGVPFEEAALGPADAIVVLG